MLYRTLGRTGLEVSLLGMGTGGHDPLGQKSRQPEAEMHTLLHRAADFGINLFDTSPGYLDSELILGRALGALPREKLVISTKVALAGGHTDVVRVLTADEVAATVEASLRRLGLDHVDLLLVGVADPCYYDVVMNEHMPVLEKFRRQGKFRFLGSSEQTRSDGSHQWLERALPSDMFDVAMVGHNLINQSARRSVFPLCRRKNLGVMNVFTVRNVFANPQRLAEVMDELRRSDLLPNDTQPLDWLVADGHCVSLIEAAYRYAAYTEPVSTVMCGTLSIDELEQNVNSIEKGPLPPEALDRLHQTFGRVAVPIGN